MLRAMMLAMLLVALTGCASLSHERQMLAAVNTPRASEELECMSDCLHDADETCESCAAHCLGAGTADD